MNTRNLPAGLVFLAASVMIGPAFTEPKDESPKIVRLQKLKLQMTIPEGFEPTLGEITSEGSEVVGGLIFMIEKKNMPPGHFASVELEVLDPEAGQKFNLEDWISNLLLGELEENHKAVINRGKLIVAREKAFWSEIINPVKPEGQEPYKIRVKVLGLVRKDRIFKWRFTVKHSDYKKVAPAFNEFIKSIRFF